MTSAPRSPVSSITTSKTSSAVWSTARAAPSSVHSAAFSGPPATAITRAPAATASWIAAVPTALAPPRTRTVSPSRSAARSCRARWETWKGSVNAAASTSVSSGGAGHHEPASACSASPPSDWGVMPTTRWPTHSSAPGPAASTVPHTSMPSVNGGWAMTAATPPRQRAMSPKLSEAALTATRTWPAPGSGTSTSCTSTTSAGSPLRTTRAALTVSGRPGRGGSPSARRPPCRPRGPPRG